MGGKIVSETKSVALRCCRGFETVLFEKENSFYGDDNYTISFQSSVNSNNSKFLFIRIKNAFKILRGQTAIYSEVTEDKDKIVEFLEEALKITKEES